MRLSALIRNRCPHCLEGIVFTGMWKMNEPCPQCGVIFEREQGYFLVSIFFGYVLGFAVVLPFCLLLYALGASLYWYLAVSVMVLVLFSPLIFRYSRLLWMHLDELLDPRKPPA